ncbi:MAG: MFS transporter [Coxiella sp. RIFCSPHIGHO2_12_FULL_44_14]|nr:MAG: MFS transporter [Coxiella sp. RIFCSPHIGHO2_12_FULL_44_14]
MSPKTRIAVSALATLMAFRMLGLFMILPVFSLYVNSIPEATPALIGLAIGIYGLGQACFQIPLGMLSDRIGRKPVITLGLILFGTGSFIAASAHTIHGIVLGRAIQGVGAIGSTTLAFVADLTHDEDRSKAMAIMGMVIGFSFAIAMVLGPTVNAWLHLRGIFWITLGLAGAGLVLLYTAIPPGPQLLTHPHVEAEWKHFRAVFTHTQLLNLDFGIFSLHAILTALFIAIPVLMTHTAHLTEATQAGLYFIIFITAFIVMIPFLILAEKKRRIKPLFMSAITLLILTPPLLLSWPHSIWGIGSILLFFFIAFTLLEASLPSLISKISPIRRKGTAMGVYSSAQFLGIFVGGSFGGWLFSHFYLIGIGVFCALLGFFWLMTTFLLREPPAVTTIIFHIDELSISHERELHHLLRNIPGVREIAFLSNEHSVYLKIDQQIIREDELRKRMRESNLLASEKGEN